VLDKITLHNQCSVLSYQAPGPEWWCVDAQRKMNYGSSRGPGADQSVIVIIVSAAASRRLGVCGIETNAWPDLCLTIGVCLLCTIWPHSTARENCIA
jgi:hypothetical protein